MTFQQIRQYVKGVISALDINNMIDTMPAEDMSEIVTPLPSVMSRRIKYSTEEQIVGEWIDGKPLYQKTISFGALPNSTTKSVAHGIANLDKIMDIESVGYITLGDTTFRPIPLVYPQDSKQHTSGIDVSDTNITMTTNSNRSMYSAFVTLRYTKTTD